VILLDINLLVYAYHAQTPNHDSAAAWLSSALAGGESIGLSWPEIWGFIRISTAVRLWPNPMPPAVAVRTIRDLLELPSVTLVEAGPRHLAILDTVMRQANIQGPLVSDAVLAALAIEYGATLASTDRDFRRFPTLRWINPLEP
jgi:toxin-antitoxin system PIN domain toxin